jgi:Enoyl-CoA hydratase/isomerase
LHSPIPSERTGAIGIALEPGMADVPDGTADRLTSLPFLVVGLGPVGTAGGDPLGALDTLGDGWLRLCDVVVDAGDAAYRAIEANVDAAPIASTTLALLLRGLGRRNPDDGLVAESAAYSVLQSGPEFAAWRAQTPVRTEAGRDEDAGPRVRLERAGDVFTVTMTRPQRLNALDAPMRDELVAALTTAAADPNVTTVELRGEGRAFCAGGDLDEFGTRADPASAHLIRLERSVARALLHVDKPMTAYVHGATVGSGIELAAFADWVVATPDTEVALPEIGLGLIPGAGGTVSLPRRIGRLRTAWLAFSGRTIDAETALAWRLVDAIAP